MGRGQDAIAQCHSRGGAAQLAALGEDATLVDLKGKEWSPGALPLRLRSNGVCFAGLGVYLEPSLLPFFSFALFGNRITCLELLQCCILYKYNLFVFCGL